MNKEENCGRCNHHKYPLCNLFDEIVIETNVCPFFNVGEV